MGSSSLQVIVSCQNSRLTDAFLTDYGTTDICGEILSSHSVSMSREHISDPKICVHLSVYLIDAMGVIQLVTTVCFVLPTDSVLSESKDFQLFR